MGAACGRRTVLAGVQDDYRAVGYKGELRRRPGRSDRYLPPEAGALFEGGGEAALLPVPGSLPGGDYLASLARSPGTHALGEARSAEFLARVRRRLESLGWPG